MVRVLIVSEYQAHAGFSKRSEQDQHLDRLSHSINRQHHISLQIGDELDVHTGLLEELDTDLDLTESRLSSARRGLDRVAKGAKENGSFWHCILLSVVNFLIMCRLNGHDRPANSRSFDPHNRFQDIECVFFHTRHL